MDINTISATPSASAADAEYTYQEWDRRTRAGDIPGLSELYLPDAVLESPLVPRILEGESGVLTGHLELEPFFRRGTASRPNELARWYRTGIYQFDGRTLIWEYPRQTPKGDQLDLVEVMDLHGPQIAHHWGWCGTPLFTRR